ncbi:LytR C-terminal domain-containing protein [Streptomyces sp. NBC_01186]|uniref:LytR C-terminal domain-containing protein n=1 Tax=unclassified Streptomyces TaxID=2593676 RepID=UPI002DDA8685|nr:MULTISPECIES: LytR C-terminal domain-containing protein [unclassified Streptomyces]WSB78139.1 LytR C-terminal domain-containing protein [Streptomyces sp. NBC_01775]WSS13609.1 LytR C-terminal domain-containing protein [Streptomyces sp. NBC_01186]
MSMLTPPGMGGKYRIKGDRYPRMRRSRGRGKIIFASVASMVAVAMIGWGTLQLIDIFSGGSGGARASGAGGKPGDCATPAASRDAAAAKDEQSRAPGDAGKGKGRGKAKSEDDKGGRDDKGEKSEGEGKGGKNGGSPPEGKLPEPRAITVNVLNATSRDGLAQSTADDLKKRGFKIGKVGNAPDGLDKKVKKAGMLVGAPGSATSARLKVLSTQVDGTGTKFTERDGKDVDLVLGDGFKKLTKKKAAMSTLAKLNKSKPSPSSSGKC